MYWQGEEEHQWTVVAVVVVVAATRKEGRSGNRCGSNIRYEGVEVYGIPDCSVNVKDSGNTGNMVQCSDSDALSPALSTNIHTYVGGGEARSHATCSRQH